MSTTELIPAQILWQEKIDTRNIILIITQSSKRVIDDELENKFKEEWSAKLNEAKSKGQTLYDGITYRLENLIFEDGKLSLTLSEYKFSVRSTLKRHTEELARLGELYYSNGLSVGGLLRTTDGKYIFAKKGNKSASSLKTDLVGGVLEKLEPVSGEGILNMNKTEIYEELNVAEDLIESMEIIGIIRSPTTDIAIITNTQLLIDSNELRNLFNQREDKELDDFEIVEEANLNDYLISLGGYKPAIIELF